MKRRLIIILLYILLVFSVIGLTAFDLFHYANSGYLWLLLAPFGLAVIFFFAYVNRRKKLMGKIGDIDLVNRLAPGISYWRPSIKFWMLEASLTFFIIALARPQFGTKIHQEKRVGIETIIAIDVSNSMLAQDVAPSRLDRSKMMVENLVDNFTDDRVGLLVFAGSAQMLLPITSDFVSAKMFLDNIDTDIMKYNQGTDIAAAIGIAVESFTNREGVGKAIIIITDGENHEGGAVEAAQLAKKKGLNVYVLGVGSTKGSPVPDPNNRGGYIEDEEGNIVVSALNENMCRQIAQAGGGAYIHVENSSNAQKLLDNELDKLSKKELNANIYSEYDEQYLWFAIIALLFLVLEVCLLECRNPKLSNIRIFKSSRKVVVMLLLCLSSLPSMSQDDRAFIRRGNRSFHLEKYDMAAVNYAKALKKNSGNPQAVYNYAMTELMQTPDSAIKTFEISAKMQTNPIRKAMAYHNVGYIYQLGRDYDKAIQAYKEALRLNPNDDETRYNLELCKQMQDQQPQDQDQQQQQDQQNQDQNQQDQQQQDQQDQQDQQQDQQQQDNISEENVEQLLEDAKRQEQATLRKMQQQEENADQDRYQRKNRKNW